MQRTHEATRILVAKDASTDGSRTHAPPNALGAVDLERFELSTPRLSGECSSQMSYRSEMTRTPACSRWMSMKKWTMS